MKRNPIMPFVLIMVLGVAAMFLMSFKGLGDMDNDAAKGDEGEKTEQTEQAAFDPEAAYQSKGCVGCHGADYNGSGDFPSLKGVGDRLSQEEIVNLLVNGKNNMPSGLLTEKEAPEMAKWLAGLK